MVENNKSYVRMCHWMSRRGSLAVFILAVIPDPIFKFAGMAAGALRFPLWKFLLLVWVGETIKSFGYVLIGYFGAPFITQFFP